MRYDGSAAGVNGEGNDVRRDCALVVGGETDAIEDGRDGNSCDSLSDPPEVFLRVSGGRAWEVAGEPARSTVGTASGEGLLFLGGPTWSGSGTPAIIPQASSLACAEIAQS